MNKEEKHELKLLISSLSRTQSKIQSMIGTLNKALQKEEKEDE